MMSRIPVPGVIWQTVHYLVGLQRLGCEVWYVEDHGMTPTAFFDDETDDGWERAAGFVDRVMRQFGFRDRWAYHVQHAGGRHFGMRASELGALYRSADVLLNLHGATQPRPEHAATGRLVLLETDPVELEVQLAAGDPVAREYASAHCAFFTFGENVGRDGCGLPATPGFKFVPTRQPVVLDFWDSVDTPSRPTLTTIGNWRQLHRSVQLANETYHWSKHLEFLRFLELPRRTGHGFELALASCQPEDRALLEQHGWAIRAPFLCADSIEDYRRFIASSYGEFTVAKDQNIRLQTGWFSDRSATYLAAGRPVITQDTGFGRILPTGKGLLAFHALDEAVAAVEELRSNYRLHQRAAREIARDFFSADIVLRAILDEVGVTVSPARRRNPRFTGLPAELDLRPVSRWPLALLDATTSMVEARIRDRLREAAGHRIEPPATDAPKVSIIVVVHNGVIHTTMCLESVLADTDAPSFEVVVVDNGSTDDTPSYLHALQYLDGRVRTVPSEVNLGFAGGNNAGIQVARGETIVLLNNDTVITPGWLQPLLGHLKDPTIGLVGPTTNRTCNEAQIDAPYCTVADLQRFVDDRRRAHNGTTSKIGMLAMFCVAGLRSTFDRVGPLDECFELGMFEDDDYAMRVRAEGLRLVCGEDAFVHHFGQASIGRLLDPDAYDELFTRNRVLFESKWNLKWSPHGRRTTDEYGRLRERVRIDIEAAVPEGSTVLITAKGDDDLLQLTGRTGAHYPGRNDGSFLGEYPIDSAAAIQVLEAQRTAGADYVAFPAPSAWWLDHYAGLRSHLEVTYGKPVRANGDVTIWSLTQQPGVAGAGDDTAALRRMVAAQADAIARMQAEVAALRAAVNARHEALPQLAHPAAAPEPTSQWQVPEAVQETWRVLERALDEGGASKHTRYLLQRARLKAATLEMTSPGSTVAVISRGDDELITLSGRTGCHLPRLPDGDWSAGLPADGMEAVRHLELVRALGADYLVLPAIYGWWLDYYRDLSDHLSTNAVALLADPQLGWIWSLESRLVDAGGDLSLQSVLTGARQRTRGADPTILDWDSGIGLARRLPELAVFSPPLSTSDLPYLDATVDVVVVGPRSDERLDEARRVASVAVVQASTHAEHRRYRVMWNSVARPEVQTVSIIIPCGLGEIPSNSDAIVRSLPAPFEGEVLVPGYDVAGQPSESSDVILRVPPETDVVSWARAASEAATGDVVVFVDPALLPLRGWLDALLHDLGAGTHLAAANGALLRIDGTGSMMAHALEPTFGMFAIRRDLLIQCGGLPSADTCEASCSDLAGQLGLRGHRVASQADAIAGRIHTEMTR